MRKMQAEALAEAAAHDKVGGKWRGVSRIKGTATIYSRVEINEGHLMPSDVWLQEEEVTVRFELRRDDSHGSNGLIWRAHDVHLSGTARIRQSFDSGGEIMTLASDASYRGPPERPREMHLSLNTTDDGKWEISTPGHTKDKYTVTRLWNGRRFQNNQWVAVNETETKPDNRVPSLSFTGVIADTPGQTTGTWEYAGRPDGKTTRGHLTRGRIEFWPEFDDVRLEVAITDYGTWLPRGNLAAPASPGSHLKARAVLVPAPGRPGAAGPRARSFRFELAQVSREPGVAMNWPNLSQDGDAAPPDDPLPDLRFGRDGFAALSNEDLTATLAPRRDDQDRDLAEVQVASYDYGGTAELRVVCVLTDGREIVGRLEHAGRSLTEIPLPFRRLGSRIAEAWRERHQLAGDDKEDDDALPAGGGQKGDGFSHYEEYRGFVHNRGHLRTHPGRKDLFIENTIGRRVLPGLFLFTDLTQLRVHYELRPNSGELPLSRRMNLNRSANSPRSTEEYQHGLVMTTISSGGMSEAVIDVGLWRPKNTLEVRILASLFAPDRAEELAATVAHELLHAIGTHHHGETDPAMVAWMRKDAVRNGVRDVWFEERPARWSDAHGNYIFSSAPGARIRIFRGDGAEVPPDTPGFLDRAELVYVATHGGQHSGAMECVMRYDCALAYVLPGRPRDRLYATPEPPRTALCASATGTLLNAPGPPVPRYGSATAGNCQHQFCVRDDAPDPAPKAAPAAGP